MERYCIMRNEYNDRIFIRSEKKLDGDENYSVLRVNKSKKDAIRLLILYNYRYQKDILDNRLGISDKVNDIICDIKREIKETKNNFINRIKCVDKKSR